MSGIEARAASFGREIHALSNGLGVLLLPRKHLPIIAATALVRAGAICERPGEAGLATFATSLLTRGTRWRSAVKLAEDIDALGAHLGVHSDYDYSMVGLSCLSRQFRQALEILTEVLTQPAFAPDEVERRRNDILSYLERKKDDPVDLVRNRFIERIYGEHPYHHSRDGYPETIRPLQAPELRAFHETFYRPNQTILALVGDFDPQRCLPQIDELLGSWPARSAPDRSLPPIPVASGLTVERIQKDGVTQATLRAGSIGIRRNSPDYVPLVLLNYILGGSGFGSRLMTRLRQQGGLTYGAYSNFHPRFEPGYFFASCQTGLATMNEALAALMAEIRRVRDEGITEDELEWARRFFTGSLPLTLETNDQLAARVLEREFYGLPDEFWLHDIERMRATTRDEVNAAAERYLHPENFAVVCLADFRKVELRSDGL
jgi:zinc protease